MKSISVFCILVLAIVSLKSTKAQCSLDKKQIIVTPSTDAVPLCSDTTVKSYQLQFEDASIDFTFNTSGGVYLIDTAKRGATLTVQDVNQSSKQYQLSQILIRLPPIFRFPTIGYHVEMQLYFTQAATTNSVATNDIVLSHFFILSEVVSSKASSFLAAMDPTIVGDSQSVNLSSTLQSDISKTVSVQETASLSYQSKSYTWLFSEQSLVINRQQYDAFLYTSQDPYLLLNAYDQISSSNGQCTLDKSTIRPFCIHSHRLIVLFITFALYLLL